MATANLALTEAEWTVIKAVWQTEPCTAPAIQEALFAQTQWTYSTARTVLDRMTAKGLLKAEKTGKMTIYRSAITQQQAQRGELLYALKHAFNGILTPMVQSLIEDNDLNAEELEKLEKLIREKRRKAKP